MLGISDAAKKLGLIPHCGKISVDDLVNGFLPCILHWNQNHFVVLYKIKNGNIFYIADPGKGLIKYTKEEFISHWGITDIENKHKGIVMFLKPADNFNQLNVDQCGESRSFIFYLAI